MSKFKVGDEVICIVEDHRKYEGGTVHTVEKTDNHGNIKISNDHRWWNYLNFELYNRPAAPTKWHPHHDKIIKWLENEGSVVCSGDEPLSNPSWYEGCEYRVVTKQDLVRINKLKSQIKKLQEELEGLENL